MAATVDMTYRFVWDSEPSDEQLLVIMQEVAEEARRSHAKVARQIMDNLKHEYALAQQHIQPE